MRQKQLHLVCYLFCTLVLVTFSGYIAVNFLFRAPSSWRTVSDYSRYFYGEVFIGIHFVSGFFLQLILPLQILPSIRNRAPAVHRYLGYLMVLLCISVSLGGLLYIGTVGTVGGISMDVSFTIYGVLVGSFAVCTFIYGRRRNFEKHRDWATRLVSVAIGSALYRLYVLPLMLGAGEILGPRASLLWLNVAAWLFYLPNLVIAELVIRFALRKKTHAAQANTDVLLPDDQGEDDTSA
mmetsp:Transcript_8934/g.21526  ORF Transcript_8934/g.21526 Transcript_8934/m.21526 type:complete len:237 (-) Transcript_8934:111-821(-)